MGLERGNGGGERPAEEGDEEELWVAGGLEEGREAGATGEPRGTTEGVCGMERRCGGDAKNRGKG